MKTNIEDSDLHKLVQLLAHTGTPENDELISRKLSERLAGRRDGNKTPPAEDMPALVKREMVEGAIRAGYSAEEAGDISRSLEETIADPARWARFLKTQELSERHGAETFRRVMQGMAEIKDQRDNPQRGLKAWTEAEDGRRSRPRGGKGSLDLS